MYSAWHIHGDTVSVPRRRDPGSDSLAVTSVLCKKPLFIYRRAEKLPRFYQALRIFRAMSVWLDHPNHVVNVCCTSLVLHAAQNGNDVNGDMKRSAPHEGGFFASVFGKLCSFTTQFHPSFSYLWRVTQLETFAEKPETVQRFVMFRLFFNLSRPMVTTTTVPYGPRMTTVPMGTRAAPLVM